MHILRKEKNPSYSVFGELNSFFSVRLVMPRYSSEKFRRSFTPAAVKFFNEHCCWLLTDLKVDYEQNIAI